MAHQGVKFKIEMVGRNIPKDPRIKELKHWCRVFHRYNLTPPHKSGSCGNLSFRLENDKDPFIITGSRIGLKDALPDNCFVKVSSVDLKKGIVCADGIREPSSESMLHSAIYRRRKDVNAIFHGHSQEILSCANKLKIPETKQEDPYGSIELVQSVLKVLGSKSFLVIKKHGFISLGRTMEEAGEIALQIYRKCT